MKLNTSEIHEKVLWEWNCWPLRDEVLIKRILLLACILLVGPLFFHAMGILYAVLAPVLLAISLVKYLLPSKFILTENGVTVCFIFFKTYKNWNYYKRYCRLGDGIFLSRFAKTSRLDSFQGLFLRFDKQVKQEEIFNFIKTKLDQK